MSDDKSIDNNDVAAAEQFMARVQAQIDRAQAAIDKLPEAQQARVLECVHQMHELALFFGPYFRHALTLVSCEIVSGSFPLPAEVACDRTAIMLPGGKSPEEHSKLIIPGVND